MKQLFLKSLRLQNFCNYEDYEFSFVKPSGEPYQFICFFGPNGIGKSSLLEAISLLTMDHTNRPMSFVRNALRKYVRNTDYNPSYNKIIGTTYTNVFTVDKEEELPEMIIEGVYSMQGKDYIVRMNQNGWVRNDLAPTIPGNGDNSEEVPSISVGPWGSDHLKFRRRISHFITSDKEISRNNFQLHTRKKSEFENIISQIMRFPAYCVDPSDWTDNPSNLEYCTDLVIVKQSKGVQHKIHFKRMSDGEKKICKSFSDLLNLMNSLENPSPSEPAMPRWPRILLMDNAVMHIYYDRHIAMINCLKSVFNQQQIFATTHSGTLIEQFLQNNHDQETEMWVDLEKING